MRRDSRPGGAYTRRSPPQPAKPVRYPPHILEEIRARLPASSVVGRRVQLKKAGREWRGLSPFNAEKSPSFYVNDQKQFYHCFSSGKHGDVFTFLMETEGLSFPEAVERLAGEAGVNLPAPTMENRESEKKRATALDVMEMATAWFEERLRSPKGTEARAYLDRRGLGEEVRARFRLGYAPGERYALRDHLAAKGIDRDTMVELGLLAAGEDFSVPYDYFRDRVMFPITDLRGRVVAFGGRALSKEVRAKYLNSPETPLFHKGRMLYNLHAARKAAHDKGTIITVEGYVDVIAMTLSGHAEAVAPLGTALTEDQLALLWRHADEPILCFDGDAAGVRAAHRALDLALPLLEPGRSLRVALLPGGQDPDDLLRSGGPGAIDKVLEAAIPLSELLWRRAIEAGPHDTPERRAGLARDLRALVQGIRDETVRRYYRDDIEERLRGLSRQPSRAPAQPRERGRAPRFGEPASPRLKATPSASMTASAGFSDASPVREAMIAGTLLAHPDMAATFGEEIAELDFADSDCREVVSVLLACAADVALPDADLLQERLTRSGLVEAARRVLAKARSRERAMLDPQADPAQRADALRQAMILHQQAGALHSELHEARQAFEADPTDAGWAWVCDVKERLATVLSAESEADLPATD